MKNSECYLQLFFSIPILFSIVEKTWCERPIQPYGPILCGERCQHSDDCSSHVFDEVQLTCRLVSNTSTLNLSGNTGRTENTEDSVPTNQTQPQKDQGSTIKAPACPPVDGASLHNASKYQDLDKVKWLVNQGVVDVNCRGDEERTPIMMAALRDDENIFDFLIKRNADLLARDVDGYTVLHYACAGGNISIVLKLLIDHNMSIECKTTTGLTPLLVAVRQGNKPVVIWLAARGADVKAVDNHNETILHKACHRCSTNMMALVLMLNKAYLDHPEIHGATPLMFAARYCGLALVRYLHQQKANVTLSNKNGDTVLHLACFHGKFEIVKYLLTLDEVKGLKDRKDNAGCTPERLAKLKGHSDIVSLLLSQ